MLTVTKRNGDQVPFNSSKIRIAIEKAFKSSKEIENNTNLNEISSQIVENVLKDLKDLKDSHLNIEVIQDVVEKNLMKSNYYVTAKMYILYRSKREEIRRSIPGQSLEQLFEDNAKYFDHDLMRQFVYYRTYSKWIPSLKRREVWSETVDRYMDFMRSVVLDKFSEKEYEEIREAILYQRVMPSMRLLQFAGPAVARCNLCAYNCSFTAPNSLRNIAEVMYISMSGTGVGFSVESKHVEQLPIIQSPKDSSGTPVHKFIVQDSKEGWCDAFLFGLEKWHNGEDVEYDYSLLRPSGARLKTMGGRSSGPKPLMELLVFTKNLILKRVGHRLSTMNVHDILCKIGDIVVSGGVRRSALISLSDLNDTQIRDCKQGEFWNSYPHRCLSNNSAVYMEKPSMIEFMDEWISLAKSGTGERGIFNRGGLRKTLPVRRLEFLGDEVDNLGINPCAEIFLQPMQTCNLSEVICRSDDTEATLMEKIRIATMIGTYQSMLSKFKYISSKWAENQEAERLLGVSLTGQADCALVQKPEVLRQLRDTAIKVNQEYADKLKINHSTCITAVKPSGTVSQLVNASSGIHPRYAPYYIRRIRISATDPLLKLMMDQGFNINPENGQEMSSATTYVIDFYVKSPEGAKCTKDFTALEQLEYWKNVKINYTEHNPSVTIFIKNDEWLAVGQWVWENWDQISGLSFLPYSDNIYQLAPYDEITKEEYDEFIKNVPTIKFSKLIYYEKEDQTDLKREVACVGDKCEL